MLTVVGSVIVRYLAFVPVLYGSLTCIHGVMVDDVVVIDNAVVVVVVVVVCDCCYFDELCRGYREKGMYAILLFDRRTLFLSSWWRVKYYLDRVIKNPFDMLGGIILGDGLRGLQMEDQRGE